MKNETNEMKMKNRKKKNGVNRHGTANNRVRLIDLREEGGDRGAATTIHNKSLAGDTTLRYIIFLIK